MGKSKGNKLKIKYISGKSFRKRKLKKKLSALNRTSFIYSQKEEGLIDKLPSRSDGWKTLLKNRKLYDFLCVSKSKNNWLVANKLFRDEERVGFRVKAKYWFDPKEQSGDGIYNLDDYLLGASNPSEDLHQGLNFRLRQYISSWCEDVGVSPKTHSRSNVIREVRTEATKHATGLKREFFNTYGVVVDFNNLEVMAKSEYWRGREKRKSFGRKIESIELEKAFAREERCLEIYKVRTDGIVEKIREKDKLDAEKLRIRRKYWEMYGRAMDKGEVSIDQAQEQVDRNLYKKSVEELNASGELGDIKLVYNYNIDHVDVINIGGETETEIDKVGEINIG